MNRKIVFYTCFFGNDGNVANKVPPVPSSTYDCYYFTNNINTYNQLLNTDWKRMFLSIPIKSDYNLSSMDSKELKACPNHFEVLNYYEYSCYFDSKIFVDENKIDELIEKMLVNTDKLMILPKHPYLTMKNWEPNVWNEYTESLYQPRYAMEKNKYVSYIHKQIESGLKEVSNTHYTTHFILRKHGKKTNEINDTWFQHIKECGIECQISFFFINQLFIDYISPIEVCSSYKYI